MSLFFVSNLILDWTTKETAHVGQMNKLGGQVRRKS